MLPLAAAVLLTGCAKSEKTNDHETTKRYLDAWVGVNYPGVTPTELGIYILEDKPGTGEMYDAKQTFVIANYTMIFLNVQIQSQLFSPLSGFFPVRSGENVESA